jgi:hypothetical protein
MERTGEVVGTYKTQCRLGGVGGKPSGYRKDGRNSRGASIDEPKPGRDPDTRC